MIVLSDCLTNKIDEGCLKVANSLTKRLKKADASTMVISFERKPDYSDIHMSLNKFFLNERLCEIMHQKKEPVLYIPFASNTTASCLRILILSGAKVIDLSEASYQFYKKIVGNRAFYLKTGIDTETFVPVDDKKKILLREKYHIPTNKQVVLHVGHLKGGRNVDKLAEINNQYHIILVVSSVTESEKDSSIRTLLENRGNVTIISRCLFVSRNGYRKLY